MPRSDASGLQRAIALSGREVDYLLVRKRGKRGISLRIDQRGLAVTSALLTPQKDIDRILIEHERWVLKKLAEWAARPVHVTRWEEGEMLPLLGANIRMRLIATEKLEGVERAGDDLLVACRDASPARIAKLVIAWYRREALPLFAQRAFHFTRLHGLPVPQVMLSNALGRWGSCNVRREVRLAWRLLKAPPDVIDYVICHELAHLRHMNHSPAFWAEVGRMCPEYKRLREELEKQDPLYRAF
jgi:predicted metal-dependent hydrolase